MSSKATTAAFFLPQISQLRCAENVTWNYNCNSPTNAKKIFRAPSIKSMRFKSTVCICLSLSPCCLSRFLLICRKGYLIDHHRPNSRKNVPGSACPLKLAILPFEQKQNNVKLHKVYKYSNIICVPIVSVSVCTPEKIFCCVKLAQCVMHTKVH